MMVNRLFVRPVDKATRPAIYTVLGTRRLHDKANL